MSAQEQTNALLHQLSRKGVILHYGQVDTLRRAQMTLHSWGVVECGQSDNHKSWSITRDEERGFPILTVYPKDGSASYKSRIADRESGALKRVAALCQAHGLYYYHQTDPRGCSLYVGTSPLTDNNYSSNGVACSV
jgi:hypothetical protein